MFSGVFHKFLEHQLTWVKPCLQEPEAQRLFGEKAKKDTCANMNINTVLLLINAPGGDAQIQENFGIAFLSSKDQLRWSFDERKVISDMF